MRDTNDQIFFENSENGKIEKRFQTINILQSDDMVQKRMPAPIETKAAETHGEKHLPSDIFNEPEGEQLQKRTPEEIIVEPEGEKGEIVVDEDTKKSPKEKKQALDFEQDVHKTYKGHPGKTMRNEARKQGDVYYVDLADEAQKERARYDERRFDYDPRRRGYYVPRYNRPFMGQPPMDYPQYGNPHHSVNDEVAFEKALSYEIDPTYHEQVNYNNPSGNNLYSVDEGRPDSIQFYPQGFYPGRAQGASRYDYPPQDPLAVTNERFYIDADDHMKRLETSTDSTTSDGTTTTTKSSDPLKTVKHVGNGFIEITKTRRDNEEQPLSKKSTQEDLQEDDQPGSKNTFDKSKERSSILAKNSLHPLRIKDTSRDEDDDSFVGSEDIDDEESSNSVDKRQDSFQSRQLQFIDYEAPNFYNQEENYEEIPTRPRRDFLDALGMKNEEDYSEDNPYVDDLKVNNTDVHNDTHIKNVSSPCWKTTSPKPTTSHQKQDITKIKQILEEPKEVTTAKCKKKNEEKRPKKSFPEYAFVDDVEDQDEVRRSRGIETKILANKEKIYNAHEDNRKSNVNHVQVRQDKPLSRWGEEPTKINSLKKYIHNTHKINKKEYNEIAEVTEMTEMTECVETTTVENLELATTTPDANCTTATDKVINVSNHF